MRTVRDEVFARIRRRLRDDSAEPERIDAPTRPDEKAITYFDLSGARIQTLSINLTGAK